MKTMIALLCVIFFVSDLQAQVSKATLVASGLTCSMCSKAVYQALTKVDEVESVKSNIKESSYSISFKKDAAANPDHLLKAVKDAGFSVAKLQLSFTFDNVEIKNDTHISAAGVHLHFLNVEPRVLTGEHVLTIVDANFVSAKDNKKYAQYTKMKCFFTGVMESCCSGNDGGGERIYHVTM